MHNICPHCGKSLDTDFSIAMIPTEEEIKLLQLLDQMPETADGLTAETIAHHVNIPVARVRFLLGEMDDRNLIGHTMDFDEGSQYYIKREGQRALHS